MTRSVTLAVDVPADSARVYDILSTEAGQRAFWTADCDLSAGRARLSFPQAGYDLEVDVTTEPGKLVRMHVTAGVGFWPGTTWEWELGPALHAEAGTNVLFRHYGFDDDFSEPLNGHVAQTWARIMDRLAGYVATGTPRPFFPAEA